MAIKIYNTMSRSKEVFEPHNEGVVKMYVCGPTVYDEAHVGHAMSSIVFDVIRRYLEYRGYDVKHVMNYTDVDDKVILRAKELDEDPMELGEKYINKYDQQLQKLNVKQADVNPRVSEEIEMIQQMVAGLLDHGYAYEVDGDVFFRVSTDADYGRLSRRDLEDMRSGVRVGVDDRKGDPADFALWKAAKSGEPSWESPWGPGRPGWHIECSAMSLHHLGEQIDIHGGGNDLIFPHHENEIAQTESLTQKSFAKYWVHNGMMQLSGTAMSKSTGNVFTIEAFLDKYAGDVLRMLILNASYRSPLTFNEDVIQQAEAGLERLRGGLRPATPLNDVEATAIENLEHATAYAVERFEEAMDDDFNTAGALGQLFDLVKAINLARTAGVGSESLGKSQEVLEKLSGVLGLQLGMVDEIDRAAEPFIDLLLDIRQELREAKQWELSDLIRDRLMDLGIQIEDGPDGSSWHNL